MANSSIRVWVFILAIVQLIVFKFGTCSNFNNLIAKTSFQIPQIFGQDLTKEIDKVLKENDLTYKKVIQNALHWSSILYYESDILLNEIEDIIPVIDLLDQLTPDGSSPAKLTLSLPYLHESNGTFVLRRAEDIYYSLKLNITTSSRTKIINSIASITLRFLSSYARESSDFDHEYFPGSYPNYFVFVNYVKNFISFYFGQNLIPVGVMWNRNMMHNDVVGREILEADFLIFIVELSPPNYFPTFLDKFDVDIKNALFSVPSNVTVYIREGVKATRNVNNFWHYDQFDYLKQAVLAKSNYKNISEKLVTKVYENSDKLFSYILLTWATMENRNIIIATTLQNSSSEIFPKQTSRFKLILPFIKMDEVKTDACDLKLQLNKWSNNYETVVLDERSWRTLARYQVDVEDGDFICNRSAVQQNHQDALKVFIYFTTGIARQWINLEEPMKDLLYQFPKVGDLFLDTVIFSKEDLYSMEIQNFITSVKKTYKIGCSITYESMNRVFQNFSYYNPQYLENTFKVELEAFLCQPIFPLLDVMIWNYNDDNTYDYLRNQVFNPYTNIFLARELFQNVFPHIKIYIQFSSNLDKRILANLFEVPIIVPSDKILY